MNRYQDRATSYGIGWLLAIIGLILVIVFWAAGVELTREHVLGLFGLAFLSRIL